MDETANRRIRAKSRKPPLPTDIPLNCPYCGARVENVSSDGDVAYYQCPTDGLLTLPPDGRMRKAE